VSKPTITRIGERTTRIRFELEGDDRPYLQFQRVLSKVPDDTAKRAWMGMPIDIKVVDGWAEVTPR